MWRGSKTPNVVVASFVVSPLNMNAYIFPSALLLYQPGGRSFQSVSQQGIGRVSE